MLKRHWLTAPKDALRTNERNPNGYVERPQFWVQIYPAGPAPSEKRACVTLGERARSAAALIDVAFGEKWNQRLEERTDDGGAGRPRQGGYCAQRRLGGEAAGPNAIVKCVGHSTKEDMALVA